MTETEVPINQHEDIDCEITVKKSDGTALDVSAVSTLIYLIIHDGYRNVVAKFKNGSAAAGWYLMDGTDFATGILKFKVLSEITEALTPGKYYAELQVRLTSGVHVDDFFYDIIETKQYLFTVKESQLVPLMPLP